MNRYLIPQYYPSDVDEDAGRRARIFLENAGRTVAQEAKHSAFEASRSVRVAAFVLSHEI